MRRATISEESVKSKKASAFKQDLICIRTHWTDTLNFNKNGNLQGA